MRTVDDWLRLATEWSNAHPPPIGAPAGSRTPSSETEHLEWAAWSRELHSAGFPTMHWPEEWGGQNADADATQAVTRVLRQAGAPLPLGDVAVNLVAPALMTFGTSEQKEQHLPPIREGTSVWTQLFSEPEAGSDLAALRMRAKPTSDGGWILSGQKVWSTYAHIAKWGYALARTANQSSRHRGLTMFLVPMDSPGVAVVPIREITGHADFNEVFFDDVFVGPDAVLGGVNSGWAVAMSTLAEERRTVGGLVIGLEAELGRLTTLVGALDEPSAAPYREALGTLAAEIAALTALMERPALDGFESVGKLLFSELNVHLHQLALDVVANNGEATPPGWARRWDDNYMYSRAYTISGGANEVLRNVIAKRGLGLGS